VVKPTPAVVAKTAEPVTTPASAATATPKAAEPPRLYTLAELPEEIRRDLPKLVVSGSVYSTNPAQRMVVLNGQVVQEGGTPGGEVVLEQIRANSAVLQFRGYRYTLAF
jgi:general secretion pathway protein B